ncbi:ExeA family protein [Xylophilus sp.]|uniref:ExeA family protein n=1 Tax=Xylophilus sp. TaxID=2653893 RepID=UPI0013BBFFF8|nr:AAA family ATPase [Xylophilus sp.]KAF1045016.1 MAG: hypothetical protein GAK38_03242 [Xylophilus sp.]
MYARFFGLRQAPFSIAPDPHYLFMSERHREALAHLLYGLDAGGGFVLLTGEIGTGKTTVCRCFMEQIPAHCNVAYVFNPKLTAIELLRTVCDEFGVAHAPAATGAETAKDCIDPLNAFLLEAHAAGRNSVLIIDEAQNLSLDVLEQLRLLTNLETSERKLLQIILIGQPELRALVGSPSLEQLAQRVIARFHLDTLSAGETVQSIAHRLAVAGLQGPLPFDRRALKRIHALARGVPRRINLLCDRALLGAYAQGVQQVDEAIAVRAAREVFDAGTAAPGLARTPRWTLAAGAGLLVGAAAVGAAGWAAGLWPPQRSAQTVARKNPPGTAPTPAPAPADAAQDLAAFIARQPRDEDGAWQELAAAWDARPLDGDDACASLARQGLQCYRSRPSDLAQLRRLDRPALLMLYPGDGARGTPVVLRHLDGGIATLERAGHRLRLPVASLALAWRGEFSTLWHAPPQSAETPAGRSAAEAWLDAQLAAWQGGSQDASTAAGAGEKRRQRTLRFQQAQGLVSDGYVGPLTFMQLNRTAGVSEPRLSAGG